MAKERIIGWGEVIARHMLVMAMQFLNGKEKTSNILLYARLKRPHSMGNVFGWVLLLPPDYNRIWYARSHICAFKCEAVATFDVLLISFQYGNHYILMCVQSNSVSLIVTGDIYYFFVGCLFSLPTLFIVWRIFEQILLQETHWKWAFSDLVGHSVDESDEMNINQVSANSWTSILSSILMDKYAVGKYVKAIK